MVSGKSFCIQIFFVGVFVPGTTQAARKGRKEQFVTMEKRDKTVKMIMFNINSQL
jgi:hypothetical protein